MSGRSQLRLEAAHLRGRIDRRACVVHQHIDSLMHQVRTLARSPAALPLAFVCGILFERLRIPGFRYSHGLLALPLQAMQIAYLIVSPVR